MQRGTNIVLIAIVLTVPAIIWAGLASADGGDDGGRGGPQPSWTSGLFPARGIGWAVHAVVEFDDGSGPALYAGGNFTYADDRFVSPLVKWTGDEWMPVDVPIAGGFRGILAFAVFDDGTGGGPHLYVAGDFVGGILRWDGEMWDPVGGAFDDQIVSLAVFDDGSGPALYAGGEFQNIGSQPIRSLARWDGDNWSAVGDLFQGSNDWEVYELEVFEDDPSGSPSLYAAGQFSITPEFQHIARWDGTEWSPLGNGAPSSVYSMACFDDGSGPLLALTADHTVYTWDGSQLDAFVVFNFGAAYLGNVTVDGETRLYAAGHQLQLISANETIRYVVAWDGKTWEQVGELPPRLSNASIIQHQVDGRGVLLLAGRSVSYGNLVQWDGSRWSSVGSGDGFDYFVDRVQVVDLGDGPRLYATGNFQNIGNASGAHGLARWDGLIWEALGGAGMVQDGFGNVTAVASFDDGSGNGPELHVAGDFTEIDGVAVGHFAKLTDDGWVEVGGGVEVSVGSRPVDLAVYEGELYVVGGITGAGPIQTQGIIRWDGQEWRDVGHGVDGWVSRLAHFDGKLVAGGNFSFPGGRHVALWDGESWEALGTPDVDWVHALTIFDDGLNGPQIYITGRDHGTVVSIARVQRWSGNDWINVGEPFEVDESGSYPYALIVELLVHDDGSGPALYASGMFEEIDSQPTHHIAKWNGTTWEGLGGGLSGPIASHWDWVVRGATSFDDGFGNAIFVGGTFTLVNFDSDEPVISPFMARWGLPRDAGIEATLVDLDIIFGTQLGGDLAAIQQSDDIYLRTRSQFGFSALEPNIAQILIGAESAVPAASLLDLTVESRIDNPGGEATMRLRNWTSGNLETVHQHALPVEDAIERITGIDAANRVRAADGRIELAIRHAVVATFGASGFNSFFDEVTIDVR